jgi:hypothetical protein
MVTSPILVKQILQSNFKIFFNYFTDLGVIGQRVQINKIRPVCMSQNWEILFVKIQLLNLNDMSMHLACLS